MLVLSFLYSILTLPTNEVSLITGTWVNDEDEYSKLIINEQLYYSVYKQDTIFIAPYHVTNTSCNGSYMDTTIKTFDFLVVEEKKLGSFCYEITGLTDSVLAIRYTDSGKLHTFHKL